jgi:hypothetical protein
MHSELDKKYCKNVKIKMSASFLVILLALSKTVTVTPKIQII